MPTALIDQALAADLGLMTEETALADDVTLAGRSHRGHDDTSSSSRMSQKDPTLSDHDPSGGGGGGGGGGGKDDDKKGFFEWLGDAAEDAVEWVEDAAEDVIEVIEDVVEEVAETVGHAIGETLDVVSDIVEVIGEAASDLAESAFEVVEDAWNSTIGPIVDTLLEGLEDAGVFDFIDTVSLGTIDISYDGGDLHVDLGIDGVISVGLDIGEDGIFAEGAVLGGSSASMGWGSDGSLSMGAEIGLGPLAHVGGDLGVDGDGDVHLSAEGEVHIPSPTGGTLDLEMSGSFDQEGDGYSLGGEITGGYTTAGGQYVGGGYHASTTDDGHDHSTTTLGTHQIAGQHGVGEVRVDEDITIHSDDGEITGTEGEVTVTVDSIFGDTQASQTLWDTEESNDGGKGKNGGKNGGKGDGDGGGKGNGDGDSDGGASGGGKGDGAGDTDDVTRPRQAGQWRAELPADLEIDPVEIDATSPAASDGSGLAVADVALPVRTETVDKDESIMIGQDGQDGGPVATDAPFPELESIAEPTLAGEFEHDLDAAVPTFHHPDATDLPEDIL